MTPPIDTPTILIVDDTPSNLSVVVNLFEDRGYRVAIAQDGEEGFQRAKLVQPDLILLDVMMPGIDGFEACRRLKAESSTRDIPVVFMTALASSEHKVRGFQAGAVDYVTKPLQIDEVMARVGTHLKLSAAQKRLAEHNEELECRVAERTAELNESKERYRLVFENSPVSIWEEDFSAVKAFFDALRNEGVLDIEAYFSGHPEAVRRCAELAKIVDVNLAAVDLHAAGSKEALFAGLLGTFTPESFDAFRLELIGLWNGKTAMALETIVKTLAGESRNVIVHFSVCPGYEHSFAKVLVSLVDITERKQAEQKLAIKGAAMAQMHEAAYFVDDQARIFYVNEESCRQLGYSREEFLGMTVMDIAPGWTAEMVANAQQGLGVGGASTFEAEHQRKDGSILPVEINLSRLMHDDRAFGLAMVRDITERKCAERELHLLNLAMNTSSEAAFLSDAQGRFVYVNDEACRSLGYSREELLGMTPVDIDPDITGEVLAGLLDSIFSSGPTKSPMESRHRTRDGRIFPIEIAASPLRLEGENYCLTMVRDITERKRAEEELAEREQRYREIFDNAVEGMYLLEVTGDGRFRNLDINPALAASTGIPRETMIGRFVDDTVPEEMGKQIVEKYRRCVAAGATITENIELDLPVGKRNYLSTITPIRYGGRIHRLIGISRDITELKKAERALEESRAQLRGLTARREAAREEERRYIAREVHDELGQILTGLQLNVSVLTHKFAGDSPALREQLQETRVLTDRALAVARNVASALRPAALDMGIVSALEWLVGRFGKNTGIHCEVHAEDMDIQLDESQAIALFRIVQESLTNVARHAKADSIEIDFGITGDDYSLKVRDNGAGFDEKTAKTDSFGLVGMRERALLLGGEVIINSKPGEGTEIEVRIPVHNVSGLS